MATPATVQWMIDYENQLLTHYGYLEEQGCGAATLCPALSLPDLFSTAGGSSPGAGASLTQSQIDALLAAVPTYFSQAVITPDHREATLAFGIRLMPLSRQQRVIDYMRSHLHPPPGTTAALAGLPVLAAEANASLSSTSHRFLTLIAGLLAVALVLLLVLRDRRRALVPMVPIVLATGWSALILFLIGIPLNPMSATLGTLVIAISTEFSVLLSERYRQERAAGHDLQAALRRTYRSTGAAVLASGITAIVGFGVLIFSDITMLRDFGFVTLVDLSVSLLGVLLVLPAVLALSERGGALERLRGSLARGGVGAAPAARAGPGWRERPAEGGVSDPAGTRERPGRRATGPGPRHRGGPGRVTARRTATARERTVVLGPPDGAGHRHAPLPLDDRDLRAGDRGGRLRLPVRHPRGGEHRGHRRPSAALLRRAAGQHRSQRRPQRQPAVHGRPPRPAGAQRLPAGPTRPAGAVALRHRRRPVRAPGRRAAAAGPAVPVRAVRGRGDRCLASGDRHRSARTTGRSRSPTTATAASGPCTASRPVRWSSWPIVAAS